jgi:hypothetical protein
MVTLRERTIPMYDNLAYRHDGNGDTNPEFLDRDDVSVMPVPTPLMVKATRYDVQRMTAQTESQRYRDARRNGYRGPVTRAELAAKALRAERDAS